MIFALIRCGDVRTFFVFNHSLLLLLFFLFLVVGSGGIGSNFPTVSEILFTLPQ
jgi:hypothetical protein